MHKPEDLFLTPPSISLREAWLKAFPLYLNNLLVFAAIGFLASAVSEVVDSLLKQQSQPFLIELLSSLPGAVLRSLGHLALAKAISNQAVERSTSLADAYGFAFRMLGPLLLTDLVILGLFLVPGALAFLLTVASALVAIALGGIGLLALGIATFAAFLLVLLLISFVPYVLAVEGCYGWSAIRRSFELMRTSWLKVLITLVAIGLPLVMINRAFEIPWVIMVLTALYYPLPFAVLYYLYADARVRTGEFL